MISLLMSSLSAFADDLDAASAEALQKTQALLKDSKQFDKAARENNESRAALGTLNNSLPQASDQQVAREIGSMAFEKITQEAKGDPEKMKQIMSELQSNPSAMEKYLTPEAREKLRNLANKQSSSGH